MRRGGTMIAKGTGSPVVLIPGIQGRWEWMRRRSMRSRPVIRVLSSSLTERAPSGRPTATLLDLDARARPGVRRARTSAGLSLIGVSFGGLIAAALCRQRPERVTLVLILGPRPRPSGDRVRDVYLRARACAAVFRCRGLAACAGARARRPCPAGPSRSRLHGAPCARRSRRPSRLSGCASPAGIALDISRRMPAHHRANAVDHGRG